MVLLVAIRDSCIQFLQVLNRRFVFQNGICTSKLDRRLKISMLSIKRNDALYSSKTTYSWHGRVGTITTYVAFIVQRNDSTIYLSASRSLNTASHLLA